MGYIPILTDFVRVHFSRFLSVEKWESTGLVLKNIVANQTGVYLVLFQRVTSIGVSAIVIMCPSPDKGSNYV